MAAAAHPGAAPRGGLQPEQHHRRARCGSNFGLGLLASVKVEWPLHTCSQLGALPLQWSSPLCWRSARPCAWRCPARAACPRTPCSCSRSGLWGWREALWCCLCFTAGAPHRTLSSLPEAAAAGGGGAWCAGRQRSLPPHVPSSPRAHAPPQDCQLNVVKPNPRQYVARISQMPGMEVWFQRATDVVRKLCYGDVDLGIVGLDMLAEIGNDDPGARARGGRGRGRRGRGSAQELGGHPRQALLRWGLGTRLLTSDSIFIMFLQSLRPHPPSAQTWWSCTTPSTSGSATSRWASP